MTRIFAYYSLGFVFILLQTALFPRFLPFFLKPDLLLVLIIYLGLNENYVRGGVLAYLLGCLLDVFAGNYLGLYGVACLATVFVVRGVADRLNTESSLLLLVLVFCGTFLQGIVLFFALGLFADAGPLLALFFGQLLPQALLNLAAALLLLQVVSALQRRFAPRSELPGLRHLNNRYGS
ncbi:MAG: rod shape-determining protein MreD [Desulfuromonadales bacterium]|nr:rod shape-determining protein MreD [Desulfuromonadales bacterium]